MRDSKGSGQNPLASLYFLGLRMDRYFTDAQSLPVPVVSVGNISVGGRAKTPFVIEVCKRLKSEGFSPVVLTRGYGRSTKKQCFIDIENNPQSWDVECGGDEALEIAYFARVPVLVGPRRLDNAQRYLKENASNDKVVFILEVRLLHSFSRRSCMVATRVETSSKVPLPRSSLYYSFPLI